MDSGRNRQEPVGTKEHAAELNVTLVQPGYLSQYKRDGVFLGRYTRRYEERFCMPPNPLRPRARRCCTTRRLRRYGGAAESMQQVSGGANAESTVASHSEHADADGEDHEDNDDEHRDGMPDSANRRHLSSHWSDIGFKSVDAPPKRMTALSRSSNAITATDRSGGATEVAIFDQCELAHSHVPRASAS
jgi:hypothetical protein